MRIWFPPSSGTPMAFTPTHSQIHRIVGAMLARREPP